MNDPLHEGYSGTSVNDFYEMVLSPVNDISQAGGLWPTYLDLTTTFGCIKSAYSRGYLGETCEVSADCSRELDLRCGWKSSDDNDARIKTCIKRAQCETDFDDGVDWGHYDCNYD